LQWLELCNNVFFYPWLMLLFVYLAAKPSILRATLCACVTAAAAYNIHPETYACATVTAALSCLDQYWQPKHGKNAATRLSGIWRWLICCGFVALLAFMIAAPLIFTLLEFIKESSSYKFEEHSPEFLHWYDYVANLILPVGGINTFCGPVLGVLLLFGLAVSWKKHRVFVIWFLTLLLFCIRPGFCQSIFLMKPFLFVLPEYPLACCILMQSIIAARGLDELLEGLPHYAKKNQLIGTKLLVGISLFIAVVVVLGQSKVGCSIFCHFCDQAYATPQFSWAFLLATGGLFVLLASVLFFKKVAAFKASTLAAFLCLGNTALLLLVVPSEMHPHPQINYRSSKILNLIKTSGARMVATGSELFQPDTNLIYGIDDFRSLAPLHPRRYAHFAERAMLKPRISFLQECPDKLNQLFNLASVKFVLSDRAVESAEHPDRESNSIRLKQDENNLNDTDTDRNARIEKLAEGFRLDGSEIKYYPARNSVRLRLLFYIRADFKNRFYCRLSLCGSDNKILTSNVWPYLSLEEQAKNSKNHVYQIDSSLVVPASIKEGTPLSIKANMRDRWTGKDLPEGQSGAGLQLAQFKAVSATPDGPYQLLPLEENGFSLFENKAACARSYITHSAIFKNSPEAALAALRDDTIDWKQQAIIETSESLPAKDVSSAEAERRKSEADASEFSRVLDRDSDSVLIFTKLSKSGYLVLTDTFFPGWKALVDDDGKETEILPANYAFRAIKLEPGRHVVQFKYQPETFFWGLRLMQLGIISAAILLTSQLTRLICPGKSIKSKRTEALVKQ